MNSYIGEMEWRFGGALTGLDPNEAWLVVGGIGALGLLLISVSYACALVSLPLPRKLALTSLRFLLLILILVLLAGPVRVEKQYSQPYQETLRPLAVLEDRSDSMKQADNRRQQRGDDARRRWLAIEPAARKAFSEVQTFAFAHGTEKTAGLEAPAPIEGGQTELFAALQNVMALAQAGGWGGVVTLTDGLDTGSAPAQEQIEATVRTALGTGTPLYFVPGRNRYTGKSFFLLREWNVPGKVSPRSTFQLEATLDSSQTAARSVPVRLKVGGQQRPTETLRLEAGRHLYTWTAEIGTDHVGLLPVELQVGDGDQATVARAEVRVEAPANNRILYFQGALDWGYKFLAGILRDDPEFSFTPMLALAPNDHDHAAGRFPDTAAGLAAYDLVVLANAQARQFSQKQQSALTEWVKTGGVVLFLAPDDASAHGFAGSELEKMLPVVFAPLPSQPAAPVRRARVEVSPRLRSRLGFGGGDSQAISLAEFAWEPDAREIFGEGAVMVAPKFSSYAHVLRAKPGALVLARHPRDTPPAGGDDGRAILLALQRYGRGQSAVLTSDALWRWKLNQESSSHGVEIFWRQLFSWLGRDRERDLVFDHAPLSAEVGQELSLRLLGAGGARIRMTANVENEASVDLVSALDLQGTVVCRWRAPATGDWALTAVEENGRVARHWVRVLGKMPAGEHSGAATDEALLAKLAERTGGAVLNDTAPEQWITPRRPEAPEVVSERTIQLWHHPWVLGLLMTCYGVELLLRRRWLLL